MITVSVSFLKAHRNAACVYSHFTPYIIVIIFCFNNIFGFFFGKQTLDQIHLSSSRDIFKMLTISKP